MGLTTTTTTSSTSPTPTTSPDTDNDTPPHNYQAIKAVSFSNDTLKKHHQFNHHHHLLLHPQPPTAVVIYKECLKNHAANLGGHALDGCGEFMPSPTSNPSDPTSLKCAACGCHRNFHCHEPESNYSYSPPPVIAPHFIDFRHPRRPSPSPSPPPPQFPKIISYAPPHTFNDDPPFVVEGHQNSLVVTTPGTPTTAKGETLSGRKRFRSRFTPEQKEKMLVFAEQIGWKMQRCDESMVENFCNELGITRGVFKVWVHNNKNTLGKKDTADQINTNTNGTTVTVTTATANGINSIGQENEGIISDDGGQ